MAPVGLLRGPVLCWLGCFLAALIIAAIAEWFREAQYRPNSWIIIFNARVVAYYRAREAYLLFLRVVICMLWQ